MELFFYLKDHMLQKKRKYFCLQRHTAAKELSSWNVRKF